MLEKNPLIKISIKPTWNVINDIRESIKKTLKEYSNEIQSYSEITASELLENAIKYGISTDNAPEVDFEFKVESDIIKIAVSNGIDMNDANFKTFLKFMDNIKNSPDRQELYLKRLAEIMENPHSPQSQLGLYRIMYETNFELDYEISIDILTIVAILKVNS
ncbi:MAG: hypothetical protein H7A23_23140 [Leptospiraceae bacterium]|nr:hypothetical protein [Leptospiraceae bacterium]MCP5497462.1 hypothetical protein [Leptospiraceae bacterium]